MEAKQKMPKLEKSQKESAESTRKESEITDDISKKGGNTKNRNRSGSVEPGLTIRLLGNRSVHSVSVDDFAKVSQLIKQQQSSGNLMSSVDLNKFSDQSILAFVNYIQTKEIKSALTYYAITELLTLAKTFQMKDLKSGLEESIIDASKNSEADLLQALIICDVTHISPETERILQAAAIDNLHKIVTLPDFHKMPFQQIFQVLSSCELNVSHEMFVADVLLLWLSAQNNVNAYAPALFSCIRTKYLSPVDKTLIIERISTWNIADKVVRLARNTFESTNSQRVCLDANHLKKNLPRCITPGVMAVFGAHSSLPLSRPNFNIKLKKTKEKKVVEKFDSAVEPKVTDLIKVAPSEKVKVGSSKKASKASKQVKKKEKSAKSKCVCVDFVKKKLAARKSKKPKTNLVLAPKKSVSQKSSTKSETQKTASTKSKESMKSVPSKRSSSNKIGGKTTKSEKKWSDRRNQKKDAISSAMKVVKSDPKLNTSGSKSKSSKSSKRID